MIFLLIENDCIIRLFNLLVRQTHLFCFIMGVGSEFYTWNI